MLINVPSCVPPCAHPGVSEQAEALADFAVAELQRVDLWINNAGASQPTKGDLVDSDPAGMRVWSHTSSAL